MGPISGRRHIASRSAGADSTQQTAPSTMAGEPSPKRQRTGDSPVEAEKLQKILEDVNKVEEQIEAENEKMAKEILKIESKYNKAKRPLVEERAKHLREIPGFWKQVLSNHPFLAASMGEDDEANYLDALKDLDVTFVDDDGGFKIALTFDENPYFEKGTVWKQITYNEKGEPVVTTSDIKWKEAPEVESAKEFFEWLTTEEADQQDIAETIKEDVWKHPVQLYMHDDSDEEGDDEDGEGEDDSAEEEEEE